MQRAIAMVAALARRPMATACVVIPGVAFLLWATAESEGPVKVGAESRQTEGQRQPADDAIQDLKSSDSIVRRQGAETLRHMGPVAAELAIPSLIDVLADESPLNESERLCDVAGQILATVGQPAVAPLIATLKQHTDPMVRSQAARVLGQMGVEARAAIPALQAALADRPARVHAAFALWRMDRQNKLILPTLFANTQLPVANLIEALSDEDTALSTPAASALGVMGSGATTAVPVLVPALQRPKVRVTAARALRLLSASQNIEAAVPALLDMLHDKDGAVRRAAARTLAAAAPQDRSAALSMTSLLDDPDFNVRTALCRALSVMGPVAEPALPALMAMLTRGKHAYLAADTLIKIGPAAHPILPDLVELIQERDASNTQETARLAVGVLGHIGRAEEALPVLLPILKDRRDMILHDIVLEAIARVGPVTSDVIPATTEDLEADGPDIRPSAVVMLARMGPEAVPALVKALEVKQWRVRALVVDRLGSLGPCGRAAIPALQPLLRDPQRRVGLEAIFALCAIDPDSLEFKLALLQTVRDAPAVPTSGQDGAIPYPGFSRRVQRMAAALKPVLPDIMHTAQGKDSALAVRMIDLIGAMGPDGKQAVPLLLEMTGHADAKVRAAAAGALVQVADDVPDTVKVLQRLVGEPHAAALAHKLARFGPAAAPAMPELLQMLESKDRTTRAASLVALAAIGPPAQDAVPRLAKLLQDPSSYLSWIEPLTSPISSLPEPDVMSPSSLEGREFAVLTVAGQPSETVAEQIVKVLAAIGPAARRATPTLLQVLEDPPVPVRQAAFDALGRVDPQTKASVPLSREKLESAWEDLKDEDATKAYHAAWTLIVHPAGTIPWLQDRLGSNSSSDKGLTHRAGFGQEPLRALRAISVLERIDLPESRAMLERLAKEPSTTLLSGAARAALARLAKSPR